MTRAVLYAGPGSTIWLQPGTYPSLATIVLAKSGTAAAPINIMPVVGAATKPLFSFLPNGVMRGFNISGDYWHIVNIEVQNASDNCINISGSHNTIERVVVHGCADTGIQITVESALAGDATRGAFNTILNCDSYGNFDPPGPGNNNKGGENADGFAAKLYIGPGNVFSGCRAWNNSDDGWDFFAANDVVKIDNSWSFLNGRTLAGQSNPDGDGNGFKLGGAPAAGDPNQGGAVHLITNSYAFDNLACGFVQNNNPRVPSLTMCGSLRNPNGNYCGTLTQASANNGFAMTGAMAVTTPRNADGSLPAIR